MSRSAPVITSTLPVAPGTSVVTPMYTSVGFNAGDYVYQYGANLVGWPKGATVNMGSENTSIGGTVVTAFKQVSESRSVSYGPFTDQILYSGTTNTVGQIIVSPTTLSGTTYSNGSTRCCTLTDGRIAYAYRTAANTVVSAIYSAAGVLQGSVTTLNTTATGLGGTSTFSMCALSDGGFIVAYYDNNVGAMVYCRLNSSNAITVNNVAVYGASASSFQVCATQNAYGFSYHTSPGGSNGTFRAYNLSNSNTGNFTYTGSSVYSSGCAGTNSNTFVVAYADVGISSTYFYHLDSGGSQLGSPVAYGSAYSSGTPLMGCGSTANSTYPGAYAASFAFLNASAQIIIARVYASSASSLTLQATNTGIGYPNFAIGSINNGGSVLAFRGAGGSLSYATYNAASQQVATGQLAAGSIVDTPFGVSGIAGGSLAFSFAPPSTGYASFGSAYSATYTNGVTLLTGTTSYTPSNGYYLLGVSLTTAAAGSTGMVATNGSANLFSTYPVLPSNILFDSTGTAFTARSAINAQRGNVIGTNVTLRGLE